MTEFTLKSFFGINNRKEADRINSGWTSNDPRAQNESPTVELVQGINVDITDSNEIQTRSGTTLKLAGAYTSLWAGEGISLAVLSGTMYRIWDDFRTEALATGVGTDVRYLQIDGRVYWSDGLTTGVVDNGVARTWGLKPPEITSATATTGILKAGTYLVALTGVRADWQESGTLLTQSVTVPEGGGIRILWKAGDDIRDINIYASDQNSTALYLVGSAEAVDGQYTYLGGNLGRTLDTQWLEPPQPCQCMTNYRGRLYTAVGEFLFASSPLGYELFDMRDFLSVDGSRITMVTSVVTGMYVGTGQGFYFLTGDSMEEFQLVPIKSAAVIYGSDVTLEDGYIATGRKDLSGNNAVIFTTDTGVVIGLDNNETLELATDTYKFRTGTKASAVFRNDPNMHQYVLFQQ